VISTIGEPTRVAPCLDEATARCVASEYIQVTLGPVYRLEQGFYSQRPSCLAWRFLVIQAVSDAVTGYIDVDTVTGQVIPLADEQLQDMRERALVIAAQNRQALARDERGYILPFVAKSKVNGYLTQDVAFFASAHGQPTWLDGQPPVWRVATRVRLSEQGSSVDFGAVDVDALTGEVIRLTDQQIQNLQRSATDVAAHRPASATATG
jgi:hypothetical protein